MPITTCSRCGAAPARMMPDNRFEWRANPEYLAAISSPIKFVREHWQDKLSDATSGPIIGEAFQCFAELQAVAGGTTALQEDVSLTAGALIPRRHVLVRNTGVAEDMGFKEGGKVDSPGGLLQTRSCTCGPSRPGYDGMESGCPARILTRLTSRPTRAVGSVGFWFTSPKADRALP